MPHLHLLPWCRPMRVTARPMCRVSFVDSGMTTQADPRDADQYLVQAWASYEAHALGDAVNAARSACSKDPNRPDSAAALGWFLLENRQLLEAGEVLRTALIQHPQFPSLHWYLGLVCFHERKLDRAHESLQRALQLDPKLDEAAVALAWVCTIWAGWTRQRIGQASHCSPSHKHSVMRSWDGCCWRSRNLMKP